MLGLLATAHRELATGSKHMANHRNTFNPVHSLADMSIYELSAEEGNSDVLVDERGYIDGLAHGTLAYFREGRTVSLLLLGSIYLVLALSLNGAGWTGAMGMDLLIFVVLGALSMGVLMAFSRFDSFFMLSHSIICGLAWVFYLMTFLVREEKRVLTFIETGISPLQARAYFLLERWGEWIEAAVNQQASNDNFVFIFEISILIWWLTYLGVWSIFRHGQVWRGVVMAGIAQLVNTYYAPISVMGFLVAYCILALLLLVWMNLIDHRQRWRAFRIYFSEDIGFDFMRTGLLYTSVVIGIAFIAPNIGRNITFHDMLRPINQRWEVATQEWNRLYQGLNRQSRGGQAVFGRTLTLSGARNVTDRPVLEVATNDGRYWRAVTFDHFSGRQWVNTAQEEATYGGNERIPTVLWTSRTLVTQTITILATTGNVLFALPDVVQASIPLAVLTQPLVHEGTQEGSELTWSRARVTLDVGDSYQVISHHTDVTIRELREVDAPAAQPSMAAEDQWLERYLQLPDSFSPRVAALAAQVMAAETTMYDKVKTLERFLRDFEYDEDIPAPLPDEDPLEYFLFDIQRGYCDYYASAMATMLRSQGIPARTASGYAEGTYDPETDTYLLTERDAHTWVEVYFPKYGWIEFEPTSGESILDRPSGAELRDSGLIPGMDEILPEDDEFLLDDGLNPLDNLPQDSTEPIGGISASAPTVVTSIALTVLALVIGVWLLRRRMYQGPKAFMQEPQIVYERLLHWAVRLQFAPHPALTPYERSALLVEQLPQGSPFIERITEIYVQFRYAQRPGPVQEPIAPHNVEQELNDNWRQLRPVLWKAWLRRKTSGE